MFRDLPLVSIVTPACNAGSYVSEAIESVLSQDYPNIEYTIIDSNSSDDTHQVVSRYRGRVRSINVPRHGAAFAIHAGLSEAQGSILAWLSADDTYEPGAVRAAVETFLAEPKTDVVYGDAYWIDQGGLPLRAYPTLPFHPSALARDCFICQPATFFRASAYAACALNVSLAVSFDYDLWIRMAQRGCVFEYLPRLLANSRMHRANLTLTHRKEVFELTMELLAKHYGYVPLSWIYGYLAYQKDGRDQFFEPLRYSPLTYAASLPFGLSLNRRHPFRYVGEWAWTPIRGIGRACVRSSATAPVLPDRTVKPVVCTLASKPEPNVRELF